MIAFNCRMIAVCRMIGLIHLIFQALRVHLTLQSEAPPSWFEMIKRRKANINSIIYTGKLENDLNLPPMLRSILLTTFLVISNASLLQRNLRATKALRTTTTAAPSISCQVEQDCKFYFSSFPFQSINHPNQFNIFPNNPT